MDEMLNLSVLDLKANVVFSSFHFVVIMPTATWYISKIFAYIENVMDDDEMGM